MSDTFLDSSVVVGLHFRHKGERAACAASLGKGEIACSRYVIFEVARGFLRNLLELHNRSFEHTKLSDLKLTLGTPELLYKRKYMRETWIGAFIDFQAALEEGGGPYEESQKLQLLRSKIQGWVRRGWRSINESYTVLNDVGCHTFLPAPVLMPDGRLVQDLPNVCGEPAACGVRTFFETRSIQIDQVLQVLKNLAPSKKKGEINRRIIGIETILSTPRNDTFEGAHCHSCGDALICIESPAGYQLATKNKKHFAPIAEVLNKVLSVPLAPKSTRADGLQQSSTESATGVAE